MRRVGRLFERFADWSVLTDAAWKAACGKRDRREVASFLHSLDRELAMIAGALLTESYQFGPYTAFDVRDTKRRTIHAPSFRDRVVHHAIISVAGPTFERGASPASFACRAGKGNHAAIAFARRYTRADRWYGKIDVEKFYDSVDHGFLMDLLGRRFRERRVLGLFRGLLASYEVRPGTGIPIGALTSQYLGNFLLDEFDWKMIAAFPRLRLARYMDDILFWGTRTELASVRRHAVEELASMKLRMKHDGEWNRCTRGVPFLGFVVYPERMRLGARGRRRLRRKLGSVERAWLADEASDAELQSRATSLFAHAGHAHDLAWRREALRWSPLGIQGAMPYRVTGAGPQSDLDEAAAPECRPSDAARRVHFRLEAGHIWTL